MARFIIVALFLTVFYQYGMSQVINGYAKVTSIAGSTLTLSNVDESVHTFEDDEWVILMQMQDDVIGTTTNTAGFGDLGSISSAGLYEIRQIDSHTEVAGVPATITLVNPPGNTYNTGSNSSVQIITFRQYGSPDYTTVANMSALDWDGNVGGVLAFSVPGKLTLAHNLSADMDGFRGAGANGGSSTGCTGSSSYRVATGANHADKGEGIYKATDANYEAGRAHILSGGGGGNSHNAGGGGGGNYTGGGLGGPGWPTCTPTAGGVGGLDLSANISASRMFMGGGAGAGEGNNGASTRGADGGGIILISADEIETVACGGISITANGGSIAASSGNDGSGGGGAGGSIFFDVNSWTISGSCPLTISANGGDGGAVNSSATHGGGGGGGQGVIIFSTTQPSTNVTTTTNNGNGGCNNNSVPCNSAAGSGTGTDGSGIIDLMTGPLPIELLYFEARAENKQVRLDWVTLSERNNDYFTVERSIDGIEWQYITQVDGAGNSSTQLNYTTFDFSPLPGLSYYRLKQTDFDGSFTYSEVKSVLRSQSSISVYPNPAKGELFISGLTENGTYTLTNALGSVIAVQTEAVDPTTVKLNVKHLSPGIYHLEITGTHTRETHRFIIEQ